MKKEKGTSIVFLLDMTGSMYDIKKDTIGGFNSLLEEQQKDKNKINFWMTLFNDKEIEKRYVNEDIKKVKPLTELTYIPSGFTPLWDAIGNTMQEFSNEKNVMFVILTDGEENASKEFNSSTINKMIAEKEKNFNWKFLYLGVDIKNFKDVDSIGIQMISLEKKNNTKGIYKRLSDSMSLYSNTGKLDYK